METGSARNDLIERWLFDVADATTYDDSDDLGETVFSPDELRGIHYWLWLAAEVYTESEAPNDYARIEPKLAELLEGDVWGEDDGELITADLEIAVQPLPNDQAAEWVATHRQELIALVAAASSQMDAVNTLVETHGLSSMFAKLCLERPIWQRSGISTNSEPRQGLS